ncbi:MAG: pyridoxamine 5'-phosphate oxidase family protein [Candidatus Bathyarchaeia archaeon]
MPDTVKKFIQDRFDKEYNGAVGVLSSLRSDGTPNASPKHFRVRDDEHLEFTDVFSTTLSEVLKKTPDVTVVFFDAQAIIGFRMRGKAVMETFGPLFQQAANHLENLGFKPKAVVSIKLDEVQSLAFSANTGKKVA